MKWLHSACLEQSTTWMNYTLNHLTLGPIHKRLFNLCKSFYAMICWVWMDLVLFVWRGKYLWPEYTAKQKHINKNMYTAPKKVVGRKKSRARSNANISRTIFWANVNWKSVQRTVGCNHMKRSQTHITPSSTHGIDCGKTLFPFALKLVRREASVVFVVFTFQ